VYGVYEKVNYDNEANLAICNMQNNVFGANGVNVAPPLTTTHVGALTNVTACNNDWGTWNVGSRTQYNITPAMYVGVDVIYSKLQTASAGGTAFYTATANTAKPSATYQITNQDTWAFRARFHRDILP